MPGSVEISTNKTGKNSAKRNEIARFILSGGGNTNLV